MNVAVALQSFVAILWVVFVGLLVLLVMRASRGFRTNALVTAVIAVLAANLILTTVSAGLVFMRPEERGVVISAVAPKGYREQALQPGLNWIVPFMETVERYPISRQTYTMSRVGTEGQMVGDDSIVARTADGQEVTIDASVIYAIDPDQVVTVHIAWQDRYADGLVRPLARGILRDAISQYGIEEVYSSKRTELTNQISSAMSQKLNGNGLLLIEFILRDISFSQLYADSVEQKQISEQQAQQAKLIVEKKKQEAEQARQQAQGQADASVIQAKGQAQARLVQAQAEAQALQTLGQAIASNKDLLSYLYITKINPNVQVMLLPENVPYLLPLPTLDMPATSGITNTLTLTSTLPLTTP